MWLSLRPGGARAAIVEQRAAKSQGEEFVASHKCSRPFCEVEFEIRWGIGTDSLSELLDLGLARGLVDKTGNHLSFAGSPLGNGRQRSRETLAASLELQNTLRQAILASGPVKPGRRSEAEAS